MRCALLQSVVAFATASPKKADIMPNDKRATYVTRDAILKLLSDDEVSAVSEAETAPKLSEGDEYVDLAQLDRGVRTAGADALNMSRVLPKKSVQATTWSKILKQMKPSTANV